MTKAFVARQPIFDRRQKVVGYELLFRDDEMLAMVAELKRRGHRFALDDFLYTCDTERLLGLADQARTCSRAPGSAG